MDEPVLDIGIRSWEFVQILNVGFVFFLDHKKDGILFFIIIFAWLHANLIKLAS